MIKQMKKIGNATLYCADCKDVLPLLKDIDACVTDPPYGLSFMGKQWDYDVPSVDIWTQVHDVLKPGSHLLSFFGSRTYHRGAIPIEDAGFEIRDQLMWLYGSGFPKSHNIGKAVDKIGGKSLKWFIDYVISHAEMKGISKNDLTMLFPSKNGNPTGWLWNKASGNQGLTVEQFNKIKTFLRLPFQTLEECEREIVGKKPSGLGSGKTYAFADNNINAERQIDVTKGDSKWEGWGTALKPAHEPIVMARKRFAGSVAENVLQHGTGGINIDECRVGTEKLDTSKNRRKQSSQKKTVFKSGFDNKPGGEIVEGRFPANVMHDGSEVVGDIFPGNSSGFFYSPKASKKDKDEGNEHPTVKPTELMRYLCRLVTPKGGVIVDPFMGSGSTGKAAIAEGFGFVGIEMDEDYFEIACARIEAAYKQKSRELF